MISFLKLIKINNILLISLAQLCIKYGFFEPFGVAITLNNFGMFILVIATAAIAASGNVIIAIYDNETKSIPEKSANKWFMGFSIMGVLLGFYIANMIGKPGFSAFFIIASGMFYLYASYLKEILVIKNIVPAILVILAILAVPIFDLLPVITEQNKDAQKLLFFIILDYSILVLTIIIIRELVKDCIQFDKNTQTGLQTIPHAIGKNRMTKILSGLTTLPIAMVIYYMYNYLFNNVTAVVMVLISIIAPLLFFLLKSWTAKTQKDFRNLSFLLKIILFLLCISLLMYQFILL